MPRQIDNGLDQTEYGQPRSPFKVILISLALLSVLFPLVDSYIRSLSNSLARKQLNYFLSACRNYWSEAGDTKRCDDQIAHHPQFGFLIPQNVDMHGSGTGKKFSAMATHKNGDLIYEIDLQGQITERPKK